jgi:hypothetical protein
MDGFEQLKRNALLKRNEAILKARREYHAMLKEKTTLQRRMNAKRPGRPRKSDASDFPGLASRVAREILLEGKPMTLVELTLEVQRRGCRSLEATRQRR